MSDIVFALIEVYDEKEIAILDVYKDFKTAEDARVGLEQYKETSNLSYCVIDYVLK